MKRIWLLSILLSSLFSCSDKDKKGKVLDTPTTGSISIAVDESLKPLLQAEIDGFEGIYTEAHIKAVYTSEQEAIDALLKDSVRLAVVTRRLFPFEKHSLDSLQISGAQVPFAKEGIALIVHKDNPDTTIRWEQLTSILEGKTNRWNQLYPTSKLGDLQLVFDNPKSGIIRYITDTLKLKKLPANCFAASTNEAVFDYVAKTKNAIGLIGLSWISDKDDPAANKFLENIKVVGISFEDEFYKPFKYYILTQKYRLSREVIIISREARSGLGSGFISYAASDKGQRIVLKSGLVPAKAPIRVVSIKKEPLHKIVKD